MQQHLTGSKLMAVLPNSDLISRLIERMEYVAERRKRKRMNGNGNGAMSRQEDEPEDPYTKLARKARNLRDLLHVSPRPCERKLVE